MPTKWESRIASLPLEKSFLSHPSISFFCPELNPGKDPRRITIRSGKGLNMKCPTCFHIYSCSPHLLKGCRFCTKQALCENDDCLPCFENSLASRHFDGIEKFKEFKRLLASGAIDEVLHPLFLKSCAIYDYRRNAAVCCRKVFKSSTCEVRYFICHECGHSFPNRPANVEDLQHCPFCSPKNAKMLCPKEQNCRACFVKSFASHPKSNCWDNREGKNKGLTPYDVFISGSHMADMICGDCCSPFPITCNNISTGYWCPLCKNKAEKMVKEFHDSSLSAPKYQYKPKWLFNAETNGQRSFDFAVPDKKVVGEVDGDQHFYNKVHWGSTGEEIRTRDIEKMVLARDNGHSGWRLYQPDVLFDRIDWREWIIAACNLIDAQTEPLWVFPPNIIYAGHIEQCKLRGIRCIVLPLTPAPAAPPGTP